MPQTWSNPSTLAAVRVYFCGLRNNNLRGGQVSERNLFKTAQLPGRSAHDFCKRRNICTCWTTDPHKEFEFVAKL